MKPSTSLTDVTRVVAFLSGIDTLRDEAIVTLAHSPAARALLCMAGEALDALGLSSAPPSPHSGPMPGGDLMKPLLTPFNDLGLGNFFATPLPNPRSSADRAPADSASKAASPRRRSLLIVEDNPSTRILLVYMLKADYDVTPAAGFDEALDLIRDQFFDGLVLDINLCEQRTGVDLLHAIRQIPKYKHVPAIACTAYTSFGDRERLLESGFDRYVAKPFTKEQLRNALAYLFDTTNRKTGSGYQA